MTVRTPSNTNLVTSKQIKREKGFLLVDVRCSKTPLRKFHNPLQKAGMSLPQWFVPDFLLQIGWPAIFKAASNIKYPGIKFICSAINKEQRSPVCIHQCLSIILTKEKNYNNTKTVFHLLWWRHLTNKSQNSEYYQVMGHNITATTHTTLSSSVKNARSQLI